MKYFCGGKEIGSNSKRMMNIHGFHLMKNVLDIYDVLNVVRWCGPTTSSLAIDDNNKLYAALNVNDLVCGVL